jgi:hypothetical protein
MIQHPARKPPARRLRLARTATLALLVAVVVVGGLPLRARADGSGDRFVAGNGKRNKTFVSSRSPEINHGIQNITNTEVDGIANTQASFCKRRFKHCRIVQRINSFDP